MVRAVVPVVVQVEAVPVSGSVRRVPVAVVPVAAAVCRSPFR